MVTRNGARVVVSRARGTRNRNKNQTNTNTNTNTNTDSDRLQKIPSMKEFMHRQNVQRQYRGFLRAVNCIQDISYRTQGKEEVRREFAARKWETDSLAVSMAVKEVRVCNCNCMFGMVWCVCTVWCTLCWYHNMYRWGLLLSGYHWSIHSFIHDSEKHSATSFDPTLFRKNVSLFFISYSTHHIQLHTHVHMILYVYVSLIVTMKLKIGRSKIKRIEIHRWS